LSLPVKGQDLMDRNSGPRVEVMEERVGLTGFRNLGGAYG